MQIYNSNIFYCLLLFGFSGSLLAEDILVESTVLSEEKIEPSRSASSLTEIERKKPQTVADILRAVPGIEVIRQGSVGQTTSVFVRGARSEDTLVLIDGVEANDVMAPSGGFDFSSLSPENIERIEVYRGPQGVRFGAGALGGVINIITTSGRSTPASTYVLEAGSYDTLKTAVATAGSRENIRYSFSAERFKSSGFSAAAERKGNFEADGVEVYSVSGKTSWKVADVTRIEATARFNEAKSDLDAKGGVGGDDPNNHSRTKQLLTGISGQSRFFDERLKSSLGFYFSELTRATKNIPDASIATHSKDYFLSENKKIQNENEWLLGEQHTLRFNLQWREESGHSNSDYNGTATSAGRQRQMMFGESLTYLFESRTWFYDAGLRADQTSNAGTIQSYRVSAGRKSTDERQKAFVSFGTGFKLPSLYQLYSTYGDPSLHEESARTLEAALELRLTHAVWTSFTIFENRFRELIDFNLTTNKYFNVAKARSRGFEWQNKWQLIQSISLSTNYTYLDTKDEATGLRLLRRPQNSWGFAVNFDHKKFEGALQYRYQGVRADVDANSFQRLTNSAYDLVSANANYKISKALRPSVRIENAFNRKYEEVNGFGTAGFSLYLGLSGEIE